MFLDHLAVLLDRASFVALGLERLPGAEERLPRLLRQVVEHGHLEELRQRRVVLLRPEVQRTELEVRARRECALIERERAFEGRLRVAAAIRVRQGAAARELRLGRVLEVGLQGRERAERLDRSGPVLALAAREPQAEE